MARTASKAFAPPNRLTGLAALLATSGTLHVLAPRPFERIVPHRLPGRRGLVYLSGVLEIACATGLLVRRTRRAAGLCTAALLVAVFPANVQMAVDAFSSRRPLARALALVRLPVQVPLILTAWREWSRGRPTGPRITRGRGGARP